MSEPSVMPTVINRATEPTVMPQRKSSDVTMNDALQKKKDEPVILINNKQFSN